MAKGWSFGALTDALKSSAFVDTTDVAGAVAGNAMTVGFMNLGRTNLPKVSILNMGTYRWKFGEVVYCSWANVTWPDGASTQSKMSFVSGDAVRFSCIGFADQVATVLVQNSILFYVLTVNQNTSTTTFDVKQLIASDGADSVQITQSQLSFGGNSNYATLYLRDRRDGNKVGYIQYDSSINNLYLAAVPGGSNRSTILADGTLRTDGVLQSNNANAASSIPRFRSINFSVNGPPGNVIFANEQGMHVGWNESGASGMGSFICNKGGGTGGYRFRVVNSDNSVETASWIMDGSSGNFKATGDIIAARNVYSGNGGSFMATDGNIYGGVWGGYLSNYIAGQIGNVNNNINNVNNNIYANFNANSMSDGGRGGQQYKGGSGTGQGMAYECPPGCFLTGINTNVADGRGMGVYFRQFIGRKINGGTFAIGDFA